MSVQGTGTQDDPWQLTTPPGSSAYTMYEDASLDPPQLVCVVGKAKLSYDLRALDDAHAMLAAHGDWMDLGIADEQKPVKEGTLEAWARDPANPLGGFYGLKKGMRGRFAMYVPPLLEALGRVELTHEGRNNRVRAL